MSLETFEVKYISPRGEEERWDDVLDFDRLIADQIKADPEKRKGSWFAREYSSHHNAWFRC